MGCNNCHVKQIIRKQPINLKEISQKAQQQGKQGYKIFSQAGEQAVIAAPTMRAGFLLDAPLAAGQVKQGLSDIKEGVEAGNTEQALMGGLSLGTGALMAKGALSSKGLLTYSGKMEANIGKKINALSVTRTNAKIKAATQKATQVWREVLRPSKEEIKNIEIRKGADINSTYEFMAEKGIAINKSTDGKTIDTRNAIESYKNDIDYPYQEMQTAADPSKNI